MTHTEKLEILKDYMHCSNDGVFEFIRDNKDRCADDPEYHILAKQMLMGVWVTHQIKEGIEHHIAEYGVMSADADEHRECELTDKEAHAWLHAMQNDDGTTGAHWTMAQTSAVAKDYGVTFEHIRPIDWNVAMNKSYSDNFNTVQMLAKTEDEKVKAYAMLAKDFLFDEDGVAPKARLYWYYMKMAKH